MALNPSLIDRVVGAFSPSTALARLRARQVMAAIQHFDAAGSSRRTQGMRAPGGDATSPARNGGILRRRARDMVRNNAIAARATAALVDNVIGDGIIPSVEANSDAVKRRVEDLLIQHCDSTAIDADGRCNLYGLQRLAVAGMVVSGETLVRQRWRSMSDPFPLPMRLQLLEADHFDDRYVGPLGPGAVVEDSGVRFDGLGQRTAYRLYRYHPDSPTDLGRESTLVPADAVVHLFRVDRPGQVRGVSWLAPVLPLMADAYDYADAQLLRQKIAAMWVGFIRDLDPDASGQDLGDRTNQPIDLEPGMIEHLPPGRDVTFPTPPSAEGYAEHMKAVQRMIAAALGITYEEISGDLEGVNFSSARIGRMAMQRAVSAAQWAVVIPALCEPLGAWLSEAVRMRTGDRDFRIKWTPPRFPMTDPAREVPAVLQQIAGGLTSRRRAIREMGFDPAEIDREIAEDVAAAAALGVTFDGAPMTASEPEPLPEDERTNFDG